MRNLGTDYLKNKYIISAKINKANDLVILNTKEGPIYLSWYGDCCAHCFLANTSGTTFLTDATILEVENTEWKTITEGNYETIENMGTKLKTSKGYVDLESRVEHNGYYSGTLEVSTELPYGQYSDSREDDLNEEFTILEDF